MRAWSVLRPLARRRVVLSLLLAGIVLAPPLAVGEEDGESWAALVERAEAARQGSGEDGPALAERAHELAVAQRSKVGEARTLRMLSEFDVDRDRIDSAIERLERALEIVEPLDEEEERIRVLISLGYALQYGTRYGDAIVRYKNALAAAEAQGNGRLIAESQIGVAHCLMRFGVYDEALEYMLPAHEYAEEHEDYKKRVGLLNNVGTVYLELGSYDKARHYYERAVKIAELDEDVVGQGFGFVHLGILERKRLNPEGALEFYRQGLAILEQIPRTRLRAAVENNIGNVLGDDLKRPEEAVASFRRAIAHYRQSGDEWGATSSSVNLAAPLIALGRTEEALSVLTSTLADAERLEIKPLIMDAHEMLTRLHDARGEPAKAYASYRAFVALRDEMHGTETDERVARLEYLHETARREREIESLKHSREVGKLHLTVVVILSVFLVAFVVMLTVLLLGKRRHVRQLEERGRHIELQNATLNTLNTELQGALGAVKTLGGLLPICSHCKKVRNDEGYWTEVEDYIKTHSEAECSHGICPNCIELYYPENEEL